MEVLEYKTQRRMQVADSDHIDRVCIFCTCSNTSVASGACNRTQINIDSGMQESQARSHSSSLRLARVKGKSI